MGPFLCFICSTHVVDRRTPDRRLSGRAFCVLGKARVSTLAEFNMTTTPLERYIPLRQAAHRLGISAASLQSLIDSGRVGAAQLNRTAAVAENDLDEIITREQFEHLRGQAITIPQAAETYGVNQETLRGRQRA